MANLRCPHCQGAILNDPKFAGRKIACPHCRKPLVMPVPKAAPKPAAAQSAATRPAATAKQNPVPQSAGLPTLDDADLFGFPSSVPQSPTAAPGYGVPQAHSSQPAYGQAAYSQAADGQQLYGQVGFGQPAMQQTAMQQPAYQQAPAAPSGYSQPGWTQQTTGSYGYGYAAPRRSYKKLIYAMVFCFVGLLVLAGLGVGGWFGVTYFLAAASPTQSYNQIMDYAENEQWGALWDRFDSRTQEELGGIIQMASTFGALRNQADAKDLSQMSNREAFIYLCEKDSEFRNRHFVRNKVLSEQITGDEATLEVEDGTSGRQLTVYMVREDGIWKFALVKSMEQQRMNFPRPQFPR